jgi:hypothetical protein
VIHQFVIHQKDIRKVRTQAGILAREVSRVAKLDPGRFSLIEQKAVRVRPDEMSRIEAALVELISERLSAIRSLETDRGLTLVSA